MLPCLLKGNDFELIIAGSTENHQPYVEKIWREAREWGVADRVHIIGVVSEAEKHWYLQNCEAFLFPSIAEGFGLPVVEAMQYGKPVFLSDHTCLPEIGGKYAYYFNHDFDRDAMRKEFADGLADYKSGGKDVEAIKSHARSFSWQEAAMRYRRIYEDVLGR